MDDLAGYKAPANVFSAVDYDLDCAKESRDSYAFVAVRSDNITRPKRTYPVTPSEKTIVTD